MRSEGLRAEAVSKSFAGLRALDDVSVTVGPGEIVGLIGPNGSGKTTLLNIVSGVLPATDGTVVLDGTDISRLKAHQVARRGVSRTFQNIRLFGGLTVMENVEVGAASNGRRSNAARRIASESAAEMDLDSVSDRIASTLPYGDQRRLEIARALAMRPRYLLLDEPAAGMNRTESDHLMGNIEGIRNKYGIGLLIVDHDLGLIMRLCQRVVVLNEGRVIAAGSPEDVQKDAAVIEAYIGRRRLRDRDATPKAQGNGSLSIG